MEKIPINVLIDATNNFNNNMILGKGGFAVVFKCYLNGELVAVKKFNSATMGTEQVKEFSFEIDVIGKLSHHNLVKLLGYCIHNTRGTWSMSTYQLVHCASTYSQVVILPSHGHNG